MVQFWTLLPVEGCYAMQFEPTQPPRTASSPIPFLEDARRNLNVLRAAYGRGSPRYRRLADRYRAVADELRCRRGLERILHRLSRRSQRHRHVRWHPHSKRKSEPRS